MAVCSTAAGMPLGPERQYAPLTGHLRLEHLGSHSRTTIIVTPRALHAVQWSRVKATRAAPARRVPEQLLAWKDGAVCAGAESQQPQLAGRGLANAAKRAPLAVKCSVFTSGQAP